MAKQFRSGFFDMGTDTCDVCSETTQYHYQFFFDGSVVCIENGGCRGKDHEQTPIDRAYAISQLKDRLDELRGSSQEEEEDEIGKIESFLSDEECETTDGSKDEPNYFIPAAHWSPKK